MKKGRGWPIFKKMSKSTRFGGFFLGYLDPLLVLRRPPHPSLSEVRRKTDGVPGNFNFILWLQLWELVS